MPRQAIFSADTVLFHATEGKKLFPAGEQDPGPAWTDRRGGEPVGGATVASAAKDLLVAANTIETLESRLESQAADLDNMAQERDAATGALAAAEQRATDAEKARDEAVSAAEGLTQERDAATALNASLQAQIAKFDPDGDGKTGGSKSKTAAA